MNQGEDSATSSALDVRGRPMIHGTDRPTDQPAGQSADQAIVRAAGVVCWRGSPDGLEVLLVHRPCYQDWSFPKGKTRPGELLPRCALRELAEETGVQAVLGRPLPGTRYQLPTGEAKQVSYWAGRVHRTGTPSAPDTEVDGSRWVDVATARRLLTFAGDRAPLDALTGWATRGELDTAPLVVVRHSAARPRDAWPRSDAERPLVAAGRRQAVAVGALLTCWRPEYLLSSPWLRCLETLAPYATGLGLRVRTKGGLSESGYRRNPGKARRHVRRLVERGRPAALCTHRPVLAGVLAALTAASSPAGAPSPDGLAPGEVLVAHVAHPAGRPPAVVATERFLATA